MLIQTSILGVQLWSLDSLKPNYILDGHSYKVNCVDFFTTEDNQQYLITGSEDMTAKVCYFTKTGSNVLCR